MSRPHEHIPTHELFAEIIVRCGDPRTGELIQRIEMIEHTQESIMSTIADLVAADTQLKTEVGQIVSLAQTQGASITDLQAQVAALKAAGGLSAADQASLDSVVADISSANQSIQTALPPVPPVAPTA